MAAPEAAEYLRFKSVESFYQAIKPQHIPFRRRGSKTLLFHRDELDRWLDGQRSKEGEPQTDLRLVAGRRRR